MAEAGFRRTDGDFFCMGAHDGFDGLGFTNIALGSGGAVSINIVNLLWVELCVLKSDTHGACGSCAFRGGGGQVVGIRSGAIAENFPVNSSTSFLRVFILFQNNNACSFTENKSVPAFVKGARRTGRFIISGREGFHCPKPAEAKTDHGSFTSACDD